jgi:siderophore synthetase component
MDLVARRMVSAAYREGLSGGAVTWDRAKAALPLPGGGIQYVPASRHAFGRLEFTDSIAGGPAEVLVRMVPAAPVAIQAEITNAAVNLALALARRAELDSELVTQAGEVGAGDLLELWASLGPDDCGVHYEQLAGEGHNLHPCGRTRIGWDVADVLAYDLEAPAASLGFVGVRRELHVGDELGAELLGRHLVDPDRFVVTPVHPWQLRHLVNGSYADLVADGSVVPLDVEIPAMVTAALRTLYLPEHHVYVKVSLDIQVTSTRRTISLASSRNGPALSRILPELIENDRVLLLPETAGSATQAPSSPIDGSARDRDLGAILRSGLHGRLAAGEVAIPGSALYAVSPLTATTVLAEIVDRYARTRGIGDRARAALSFLDEYARLLLPPVLGLATRHGIGLEVHLQNCLPTFVAGVPHRLAVRDMAGMRIHLPRLEPSAAATPLRLWPNSVIATEDEDVMRSKVGYTAIQAHLGELIVRLQHSHDLDEPTAWATIRSIVDEVYDDLARRPGLAARARSDHGFLTAKTVPHKALLAMRIAATRGETGDRYVRVENPLR